MTGAVNFFIPLTKVSDEQRMVYGYASTEAVDTDGETIKASAIEAALPDYMKFGNIREMHQLSAVGVAKEAQIDDKGLYLGAKVVDEKAWEKVKEGVYKGFSIGGRATARDPNNRKIITSLALYEISLVDRPANPDCVVECFKAVNHRPKDGDVSPMQLWDCTVPGHVHTTKAQASECIEAQKALLGTDLGNAVELRKFLAGTIAGFDRTQLMTCVKAMSQGHELPDNIEAILKEVGDAHPAPPRPNPPGGPAPPTPKPTGPQPPTGPRADKTSPFKPATRPSDTPAKGAQSTEVNDVKIALTEFGKADAKLGIQKGIETAACALYLLRQMDQLHDQLVKEAAIEGDGSPQPTRMGAILESMAELVQALVAEEVGEMLNDREMSDMQPDAFGLYCAENAPILLNLGGQATAERIREAIPDDKKATAAGKNLLELADAIEKADDPYDWGKQPAVDQHPYDWTKAQDIHDLSLLHGAKCEKVEAGKAATPSPSPFKPVQREEVAGSADLAKALGEIAGHVARIGQDVESLKNRRDPKGTLKVVDKGDDVTPVDEPRRQEGGDKEDPKKVLKSIHQHPQVFYAR